CQHPGLRGRAGAHNLSLLPLCRLSTEFSQLPVFPGVSLPLCHVSSFCVFAPLCPGTTTISRWLKAPLMGLLLNSSKSGWAGEILKARSAPLALGDGEGTIVPSFLVCCLCPRCCQGTSVPSLVTPP